MGTLSFAGKFKGMRKSQDFIIYPMHEGASISKIKIQSDTRIGYINLDNGTVSLCPPVSSGAYNPHLMFVKNVDTLTREELAGLIFRLVQTSGEKVGNNSLCIFTDNSAAGKVEIF